MGLDSKEGSVFMLGLDFRYLSSEQVLDFKFGGIGSKLFKAWH